MEENAKRISVSDKKEWDKALERINDPKNGTKVWEIKIMGDFSVEGSLDPTITGAHKTVRLTGTRTISLLNNGSNGNILGVATGQTIIIDGPTLQGKLTNDLPVVYIEGGNVELRSGTIRGNRGGGVWVGLNSAFNMIGGAISGNQANNGGGVYVDGGVFTMRDGAISGNQANNGGGVWVGFNSAFNMIGGAIGGNQAFSGGGVYVDGCTFLTNDRVNPPNGGRFVMSTGTISGNQACNGGGVHVNGGAFPMNGSAFPASSGIFEMSGGTISGNSAVNVNGYGYGYGGGVWVGSRFEMSGGTGEMEGGKIYDNNAAKGGGVYVNSATFGMNRGYFMMNKGTISGNYANDKGGGVYVNGSTFPMNSHEFPMNGGIFERNGGTIYGKDELADKDGVVLQNTAPKGGAALYTTDGIVRDDTIEGGVI
jgi:hypothetical protein